MSGPALRWREGDVVTLDVTNNLPEATGLLLMPPGGTLCAFLAYTVQRPG